MIHDILCIPQAPWRPKILKVKHDRKDIKLLTAKKTTYIEVNTPSTNHI